MFTKLVIIAALGDDPERIHTTNSTLTTFGPDWDCIVLFYANVIPPPFQRCRMSVYRERWGTLVRRVSKYAESYSYVALLLDDLKHVSAVDPERLISVMNTYNGSVISPGVRNTRHMHYAHKHCLYNTDFIEIFYIIFSNRAWSCFNSMFDVYDVNESIVGWGFDRCFHATCEMRMLYDNRVYTVHGRRLANVYGVGRQIEQLKKHVFAQTGRRCFEARETKHGKCIDY